MLKGFTTLWIVGLITFVPYSVWYLLFDASTSDEYAFAIVFPLFWIFGYWGVIGPLISAWKVHQFMNALDSVGNGREFMELMRSENSRETVIDMIASETHLPKFIAKRVYNRLARKLAKEQKA